MQTGKKQYCLEQLTDPGTDKRLLPSSFWEQDNSRRLAHCRLAVQKAVETRLSTVQKRRLEQYFQQGLTKSEIARMENSSCSTISKSLQASITVIRGYAELYMDIYDTLERELLQEEE